MVVAGCILGSFLGYISLSQQVFQVQYELGRKFPLFFAMLAFAVGLALLLNGNLVMRFGMHRLTSVALSLLMLLSWAFLLMVWLHDGHPPLWMFVGCCLVLFFPFGILFGNLNAIAMEPLGHVAGTAASVVGSFSTLIAITLGFLIGHAYDGTLYSLAIGWFVLSTVAKLLILGVRSHWAENPGGL